MPVKSLILTAACILFFIASLFAQASIEAEVDKTSLDLGDSLTYKVTVTSFEKNVPAVQLPDFAGFKVISSAQSSSLSFAKGSSKTKIIYALALLPADAGSLKIGPSSIKINNETLSTASFEIEVGPGKVKPKSEPQRKPPEPEELPGEYEGERVTL